MNKKKRQIPHWIAEVILSALLPEREKHDLLGDYEEYCKDIAARRGRFAANLWYWLQIVILIPKSIWNSTKWSAIMIRNYFKITIRNLRKHKGYSFINIAGLALGIACCTLIALNVLNEIYFNTFHENTDRIFCVGNYQSWEGNVWHVSATPALLAPSLKEEFPEITHATRYTGFGQCLINYGERSFFEYRVYHVDPDFLEIFTYPLIKGDKKTALKNPHSIILSQSMAEKYFPGEDPMGKTIHINNSYLFTVTAVMHDVPYNSMLRFEMLVPFQFREDQYRREGRTFNWQSNNPRTYILLQDESMYEAVDSKIENYVREKAVTDEAPEFTIIPLKKYLFSPWGGGPTRIQNLSIISSIAFVILLIACINFMNLSTARSANRAKEIGMRKVVGARRINVIFQFIGESLILSFSAMFLAVVMVIMMLPKYNQIFGTNLPVSILTNTYVIPVLIGIAFITGLIGGSYPAFFLSSFRPVSTLKGIVRSGSRRAVLRKSLVVFQFVLSLSLIIGTVVIYKQIYFIREKDMGFDKENIIYIPLRAGSSETYQALKTQLLSYSGIESVTSSSHKPTAIHSNTTGIEWEGKSPEYNTLVYVTSVDYDYIKTLNIELLEGRDFSREFPSDPDNSFLINERFCRDINKENVLGELLESGWIGTGKIIGVVKNFHCIPVNDEIPPLVICMSWNARRYAMVRISPDNIASTLSTIRETWESVNPAYPFEYNFFDAEFERLYRAETQMAGIIQSFAALGILIACLGLFGLASFSAEQRTKEISIRKVLGATVPGMAKLLSREFILLVLASNIAAWPISYFIMNTWLQSFAYRTSISLWTLVIPAFIALVFTVLTVSYQTIKAATANPVDSLRYE